jgi:hypothetical protein
MKNIVALITSLSISASAFAAGAVVDGKQKPFDLSDGASIHANLPVKMSHIVDYSERTMGAIFRSDLPCSATDRRGYNITGVKLYTLRTGTFGAKLGCEKLNALGHSIVIWDDGSNSFMMKTEWEGFIPNYMR